VLSRFEHDNRNVAVAFSAQNAMTDRLIPRVFITTLAAIVMLP